MPRLLGKRKVVYPKKSYTQDDLRAARGLADEGIAAAVDHADDEVPGWSDIAYEFAKFYCRKHEFIVFEAIAKEAYERKLVPRPPSEQAWGAIARTCQKNEIIVKESTAVKRDPKSHASLTYLWKSLIYEGR